MVDKKPENVADEFLSFLNSCPESGEESDKLDIHGVVFRSRKTGHFALRTADNVVHEIPTSAVASFKVTNAGADARTAEVTLDRAGLDVALAQQLGHSSTTLKLPFEKAPIDTLKEIGGGDSIKETPFDTLKEVNRDTIKEHVHDTLKELTADPTIKEVVKEAPKEVAWDGGGGSTLIENIPDPGSIVTQPLTQALPRAASATGLPSAMFKQVAADHTLKELVSDNTIKEIIQDHTFKELVKELSKEVAWEGTGVADTLFEGIPDWGNVINPVINPGTLNSVGAGLTPFVLATPHQASQGAVAQQMLAAQALQGRLGF